MEVLNSLGVGFLEKIYENALAYELRKRGLEVEQQKTVNVFYDGVVVGAYVLDLVVEGRIVVENKISTQIEKNQIAQTINYLQATRMTIGLTLSFGTRELQWNRLVHQHVD